MAGIGLLLSIVGFVIALMGLGMMDGANGRIIMALVGIAVSLFGILGLINTAYNKKAIWRK